jgi:hypothetical protein
MQAQLQTDVKNELHGPQQSRRRLCPEGARGPQHSHHLMILQVPPSQLDLVQVKYAGNLLAQVMRDPEAICPIRNLDCWPGLHACSHLACTGRRVSAKLAEYRTTIGLFHLSSNMGMPRTECLPHIPPLDLALHAEVLQSLDIDVSS